MRWERNSSGQLEARFQTAVVFIGLAIEVKQGVRVVLTIDDGDGGGEEYTVGSEQAGKDLAAAKIRELIADLAAFVDDETCTCHERDGSYACEFCRSQGVRGHVERMT